MQPIKVLFSLLSMFLILSKVNAQDISTDNLVSSNNAFACNIYSKINNDNPNSNLFFSPYSISTALTMAYVGAAGETAKQMKEVMNFNFEESSLNSSYLQLLNILNDTSGKSYQLEVANSLWAQEDVEFKDSFIKTIDNYYGGFFYKVDYKKDAESARLKINRWVEDKTQEKIKDLVPRDGVNFSTKLVLVNAIYFKGKWAQYFQKTNTQNNDFFLLDGKSVSMPMMTQTNEFGYMENSDLQLLEMDYAGNDLSMVVILPKKGKTITDIEKNFSFENLENWIINILKKEVEVHFPKFRLEQSFGLNDCLISLGMTDAFDSRKADFSAMSIKKEDSFYISAVIHKAFVDVEEEGTEAAAATAVIMRVTASLNMEKEVVPVFRADHPFIFLIRDKRTNSILFVGKIIDPAGL